MAKRRIYLDWNATAPLAPSAQAAMADAMAVLGNPSSVHGEGRAARRLVEEARARVAELRPAEVQTTRALRLSASPTVAPIAPGWSRPTTVPFIERSGPGLPSPRSLLVSSSARRVSEADDTPASSQSSLAPPRFRFRQSLQSFHARKDTGVRFAGKQGTGLV